MNKCPKCGHEWPDEKRAKGGKARWSGVSKEKRSAAAKKAALVRWSKGLNADKTVSQNILQPQVDC
jgi:hypothetical protein